MTDNIDTLPCLVTVPVTSFKCIRKVEPLIPKTNNDWSTTQKNTAAQQATLEANDNYGFLTNQLDQHRSFLSSRLSHGRSLADEIEPDDFIESIGTTTTTSNSGINQRTRPNKNRLKSRSKGRSNRSKSKSQQQHDSEIIDGYLSKIQQCMRSQTLRSRQLAISQVNRLIGKFAPEMKGGSHREALSQPSTSFHSLKLNMNVRQHSNSKKHRLPRRYCNSSSRSKHRQRLHTLSTASSTPSLSSLSQFTFVFEVESKKSSLTQKQPRHMARLLNPVIHKNGSGSSMFHNNHVHDTLDYDVGGVFITRDWQNQQIQEPVVLRPQSNSMSLFGPLPPSSASKMMLTSQSRVGVPPLDQHNSNLSPAQTFKYIDEPLKDETWRQRQQNQYANKTLREKKTERLLVERRPVHVRQEERRPVRQEERRPVRQEERRPVRQEERRPVQQKERRPVQQKERQQCQPPQEQLPHTQQQRQAHDEHHDVDYPPPLHQLRHILQSPPTKAGEQIYERRRRTALYSPSQREVSGWVTDEPSTDVDFISKFAH